MNRVKLNKLNITLTMRYEGTNFYLSGLADDAG